MTSGQRVGQNGERQSQHRRPCTTDQQEREKQYILVMDEANGNETDSSQRQTQGIGEFTVPDGRNHRSPYY